jgi:hypothetical protein
MILKNLKIKILKDPREYPQKRIPSSLDPKHDSKNVLYHHFLSYVLDLSQNGQTLKI